MSPRNNFRSRLVRRSPLLAVLAACLAAPSLALAASASPGDANLSPRLAELARPAVRSASPEEQAAQLSLAADGPGSLLRDGNRILVDVRFDGDA
jgi:hypothetical protein